MRFHWNHLLFVQEKEIFEKFCRHDTWTKPEKKWRKKKFNRKTVFPFLLPELANNRRQFFSDFYFNFCLWSAFYAIVISTERNQSKINRCRDLCNTFWISFASLPIRILLERSWTTRIVFTCVFVSVSLEEIEEAVTKLWCVVYKLWYCVSLLLYNSSRRKTSGRFRNTIFISPCILFLVFFSFVFLFRPFVSSHLITWRCDVPF